MVKGCLSKLAIVCDFDGTISIKDVNSAIARYFGEEKTRSIKERYRNSEIGLRESLQKQYEAIAITQDMFEEYVRREMEIDEAFFELCDYAREKDIKLVIVSGGFINYIEILFDKYGRKLDIPVYSNKLSLKDGILIPEYDTAPKCIKHYGPCGICKYQHITEFKKDYKVIYAGDGWTDRCAAESADIVFAKDNLIKFCDENNINYKNYSSFKDIKDYIILNYN